MPDGGRENIFAIKGHLCMSRDKTAIDVSENSWLVCANGKSLGIFKELPERFWGIHCTDYGDRLIIPGLIDLHLHAPQYAFRGLGMDLELIEWLNKHTFPEEAKYADTAYAARAYEIFVNDLMDSATARACIFATIHTPATHMLMDMLEARGFCGYVGKVNMDRNSPPYLCEKDAETSANDTDQWIRQCLEKDRKNIRPILTPRFVPSCSDELFELLHGLQEKYHLPVQSHLSENLGEVEWVSSLCPDAAFYGEVYDRYGLFGGECKTVMAHCVYSQDDEIGLMKERGVFIAHCPQSNTNLSSGAAPVRRFLDEGLNVGLGSDIAGGSHLSMFRIISEAVAASKLRWRLLDQSLAPLRFEEAFYMATEGGGAFFGKAGSLKPGYLFDALVLDDGALPHPQQLDVKARLERIIYLGDERQILAKYIGGRKIFDKSN